MLLEVNKQYRINPKRQTERGILYLFLPQIDKEVLLSLEIFLKIEKKGRFN